MTTIKLQNTTKASNETVVQEWPAMLVVSRGTVGGVVKVKAGEEVVVGERLGTFTFGSVVSFAMKNGQCPINSFKQAVDRGHQTHWLNANAAVIHDGPKTQRKVVQLQKDDTVEFEGRRFKLAPASNRNWDLVELK
jgi:ribosome-associated protein YbcJ (S4-like RNA binding protein)